MKLKVMAVVCLLALLIVPGRVAVSDDNETSQGGAGLVVGAEENLQALEKNADTIIHAEVNGNYQMKKEVSDVEHDVYQMDRVYTATVVDSFKELKGKQYKKGDQVEFVYPVGFKQMKDGKLDKDLVPLSDEIIPIETGEYLLFLDDLSGSYFFSNINHVYKKGNDKRYHNISTDNIPIITVGDLKD